MSPTAIIQLPEKYYSDLTGCTGVFLNQEILGIGVYGYTNVIRYSKFAAPVKHFIQKPRQPHVFYVEDMCLIKASMNHIFKIRFKESNTYTGEWRCSRHHNNHQRNPLSFSKSQKFSSITHSLLYTTFYK